MMSSKEAKEGECGEQKSKEKSLRKLAAPAISRKSVENITKA